MSERYDLVTVGRCSVVTTEPHDWSVPTKRGIIGIGHPLQGHGVVVVANTAHQLYLGQPAVGIEVLASLELGGDL